MCNYAVILACNQLAYTTVILSNKSDHTQKNKNKHESNYTAETSVVVCVNLCAQWFVCKPSAGGFCRKTLWSPVKGIHSVQWVSTSLEKNIIYFVHYFIHPAQAALSVLTISHLMAVSFLWEFFVCLPRPFITAVVLGVALCFLLPFASNNNIASVQMLCMFSTNR